MNGWYVWDAGNVWQRFDALKYVDWRGGAYERVFFDEAADVPKETAPASGAMEWLDRRVNEMRVAL